MFAVFEVGSCSPVYQTDVLEEAEYEVECMKNLDCYCVEGGDYSRIDVEYSIELLDKDTHRCATFLGAECPFDYRHLIAAITPPWWYVDDDSDGDIPF